MYYTCYGVINKNVGQTTYDIYCKLYEVIKDNNKCARNNNDPRFFVKKKYLK